MVIDSIAASAGGLGAQLRRLRAEKGMTLAELSERTGLLVSTLSKAETGKISLSYDKLVRISEGLDIDIARLFARDESPEAPPQPAVTTGRRSVSRADEAPSVDIGTYHYVYPAAELLRKSLNPMVIDVKVRSIEEFGELMRHHGEEYAYVLEGAVEFHCDLYAPVRLEKGDSVYFDSGMGHAYVAVADDPCRILSICSASEEQLKAALHGMGEARRDGDRDEKHGRVAA